MGLTSFTLELALVADHLLVVLHLQLLERVVILQLESFQLLLPLLFQLLAGDLLPLSQGLHLDFLPSSECLQGGLDLLVPGVIPGYDLDLVEFESLLLDLVGFQKAT